MGDLSKKQFYKKYLVPGLLIIISGAFIFSAILYIRHLQEPVVPAVQAIPPEVAWYGEFKNATGLWDKIRSENDLVNESLNFPWFNDLYSEIVRLDSLLNTNDDIADLCKNQSAYVCCRYTKSGDPEYLFLINLPDAHQEQEICDFIQTGMGITLNITQGSAKDELYFSGRNNRGKTFTLSVPQGIFMFSTSEEFVHSAVSHLNNHNGLVADKKFSQVMATTGKKVDANIFINLDYLRTIYGRYLADLPEEFPLFLESLGSWAGMDLIIRKEELLLSGYMNAEKGDYLDLFRDNIPQKITLTRQLPFNTAFMLFLGADNLNVLSKKQSAFNRTLLKSNEDRRGVLEQKYQMSIDEDIFSWMGKEAALIITESPSGNFRDNAYVVCSLRNPEALKRLSAFSKPSEEITQNKGGSEALQIRKLDMPELFPALFGSSFSYLTGNYYVAMKDIVIFGNSPQALKIYIASILSGKTLSTNENYIAFADNVTGKASLCLYLNIRKSVELIKSMLSPELKETLDPLTPHLKNFQAFAIQISPEKNLFYTNLYLKYNPSYKDENPAVWETKLDTTAACAPVIAFNRADSAAYIIVADLLNQVYIMDALGRITHRIAIPEPLKSPISIIENYKKHKSYLLFNTAHQIYLIDLKANHAPGFPVTTKYPLTNTVRAFDYNKTGDYRLVFACDDHKIYNYTLEGRPTTGWSPPKINADITQGADYIKLFRKDYLIITDVAGNCHFYDRRGKDAFYPSTTEFVASQPDFFLYDDGANSRIITTDHKGRIIRINPNGDWESINLKEFPENHTFLYDDFDGDEIKDYIYSDTSTITVFNNNKKIIFELDLPSGIISGITRLKCAVEKPMYGVVSRSSGHIYLFTEDGWSSMNNVLSGSWPFTTARLDRSGYTSLITASGKTVYNYYLYDLTIIPF